MLFLAALAVVAACSSEETGTGGSCATGGTGRDARAYATDIGEGEVQAFGGPTPTRIEGIVFDADGTL